MNVADDSEMLERADGAAQAVAPTPFTRQRARQIWKQRGPGDDLSKTDMTPGEDAYVYEVWKRLPGADSTWIDAFRAILRGLLVKPDGRQRDGRGQ